MCASFSVFYAEEVSSGETQPGGAELLRGRYKILASSLEVATIINTVDFLPSHIFNEESSSIVPLCFRFPITGSKGKMSRGVHKEGSRVSVSPRWESAPKCNDGLRNTQ